MCRSAEGVTRVDVLAAHAELAEEIDLRRPRRARSRSWRAARPRTTTRSRRAEIAEGAGPDRAGRLTGRGAVAGYHRAMDRLLVTGGRRSAGTVQVSGAKNSALKLMAASMLAPGRSVITNVPRIRDCAVMAEMLEHLGVVGPPVARRRRAGCDEGRRVRGAARAGAADAEPRSWCSVRCSRAAVARAWRCPGG